MGATAAAPYSPGHVRKPLQPRRRRRSAGPCRRVRRADVQRARRDAARRRPAPQRPDAEPRRGAGRDGRRPRRRPRPPGDRPGHTRAAPPRLALLAGRLPMKEALVLAVSSTRTTALLIESVDGQPRLVAAGRALSSSFGPTGDVVAGARAAVTQVESAVGR